MMSIYEEIKKTAVGMALIKDWLGEGGHVSQAVADHRSLACLRGGPDGTECPHNKAPKWWEFAKGEIAETIRRQLEVKEKVRLSTPFEDKLHMCSVCGCCLKLKIHTPIKHIKNHMKAEVFEKLPVFCWQRTEIEAVVAHEFAIGNE